VGNPIRSLLETLVELFYPSNCVGCGQPQEIGVLLCGQCKETSPRVRAPFCHRCSRPFEGIIEGEFSCPNCEVRAPAFDCVVSTYQAKGVLRELIHRFKYGREFHLRRVLADFLVEAMQDARLQEHPADYLVPVPLHPTRFRERGFNQTEALAETLSERTRVPILRCLVRRRYTNTQTRFDRLDRMQNLRNAFSLSKSRDVLGKHLVLLDDVLTTGSTLHECALVLRTAGAESVRAVTVARG
jgi:competence protein ComFC